MIYNIYVNYNKKVEAYERPLILQDDDNEYLERITRDFRASSPEAQVKMAEYIVNHVGTFDDNTGKIALEEPNPILDIASLVKRGEDDGNGNA